MMTSPHVIISGASIAGLSAAYWLRRTGWEVTVIERAPEFRDGGQNVDVRGVAKRVLDRMGLTEAIRAQNTTETGTVIVDTDGTVTSELPSDGVDGATAELEVLRGDFARVILDHLPDGVEMVYGDTIDDVRDDVRDDEVGADRVEVVLRSGRVLRADLLVIAEGVRSSTRDRLFHDVVERRDLGVEMVFGTIPRTERDDDRWRWYNAVRGRQVHLRPDNHGTTRAILAHAGPEELTGLGREDAMALLRDRYADAGWEAPRVLAGFAESDDVYIDHLTQIRVATWHRGRVCLAGDAAWCVTPMGGGGASLALTSGYVLAASLAATSTATSTSGGLGGALDAYEEWLRPLVDEVQSIPRGIEHFAYPRTRFGLAFRDLVTKVLTTPPFTAVIDHVTTVADTDRPLPELVETPV